MTKSEMYSAIKNYIVNYNVPVRVGLTSDDTLFIITGMWAPEPLFERIDVMLDSLNINWNNDVEVCGDTSDSFVESYRGYKFISRY